MVRKTKRVWMREEEMKEASEEAPGREGALE